MTASRQFFSLSLLAFCFVFYRHLFPLLQEQPMRRHFGPFRRRLRGQVVFFSLLTLVVTLKRMKEIYPQRLIVRTAQDKWPSGKITKIHTYKNSWPSSASAKCALGIHNRTTEFEMKISSFTHTRSLKMEKYCASVSIANTFSTYVSGARQPL